MNQEPKKVVLITGTSSGFGELTAMTLASAGYFVFASMRGIHGRNRAAAERMQDWGREHGADLEVVEIDIAEDTSVNEGIAQAMAITGRIDVVVNNAGGTARGPIEAFSIEEMQALFNVNVFGAMRVNKAVLPAMRARRSGLIIQVTSTNGRVIGGRGGLYPASNWAREGLNESLHYQLEPFGVDVCIVEPGSFPTPAVSKAPAASGHEVTAEYNAATPQGRPRGERSVPPPDPQDVADAIQHLIDLPYGKRPLRTVVGSVVTEGIQEYNDFYEASRARLVESLRRPDQIISWGRG